MPLAPFLHFQGTCAEALAFYARVFDAPEPSIMRYSDALGDVPAAGGDRVMYGTVDTGEGLLMASDYPRTSPAIRMLAFRSASGCATPTAPARSLTG